MQSTSTMMSTWLALYNSQSLTEFRSNVYVNSSMYTAFRVPGYVTLYYTVSTAVSSYLHEMSDAIPDGVVPVPKSVHAVVEYIALVV